MKLYYAYYDMEGSNILTQLIRHLTIQCLHSILHNSTNLQKATHSDWIVEKNHTYIKSFIDF